MPVVYNRLTGVLNPVTGAEQGLDNTFENIEAITNYDVSFASVPFRTQGTNTRFVDIYLNENGGQNPYAFGLVANGGVGTLPNGGAVIYPHVVGTTGIVTVAASTTGAVASVDANLLPAGYTMAGPITRNDQPATLTLTPTSTTNDVIHGNGIAAENYKWVNLANSAGNTEFSVDARQVSATAALKMLLESSSATNGGFFCGGSNAAGGFPTTSQLITGLVPVSNGGSCGTAGTIIQATADENQNAGALGTDWRLYTVTPGTTTQYKNVRLFGTGDVSLNDTGAALSTSATAGFPFIGSSAGFPSGTPATHTGTVALDYDSTDNALAAYSSGAWRDVKALSPVAGPAAGAVGCGSYNRVGSGQAGNAYTLPAGSTCSGGVVEFVCTTFSSTQANTLTVTGGGTINAASSYTFQCTQALTSVRFTSDGANWQSDRPLPPSNYYPEDSPGFHGFTEWNGQPAYIQNKAFVTSQSLYLQRIVSYIGGSVSKVNVVVGNPGGTFTAATTTSVTNAVSSGGLIELTVGTSPTTGTVVTVSAVTGTTEANGSWVWTNIDGTHGTLQGSVFTNAYISGGTVTTSGNVAGLYSGAGTFLSATGDLSAVLNSSGSKALALATPVTLVPGSVYYVALLFNGGASTLEYELFGSSASFGNQGLGATGLRWSVNGTTAASLPSSIVPGSNTGTGALTHWVALN